MIAAVGFLFIVPTETGLSFAATDSGNGGGSDKQSYDSGTNSDKGSTDQGQQQQQQKDSDPKTVPQGGPGNPDVFPSPLPKPMFPPKPAPINIFIHKTTKVIHTHDSSSTGRHLTVAQQNCMYSALQLGFSSNAQNRVDATYAAMMGCFSGN